MIKFEQKQILGSYFRNVRKSRKLTIRQVSASSRGISETCISEFETGRNDTSEDVISYLFNELSIDFNFEPSFLSERKTTVDKLIELYGSLDIETFDKIMTQISEGEYRNTYFYPLYLICNFYYCSFLSNSDESTVNQIISDINAVKSLFSVNEQQLYSILLYRYIYPRNEEKALKILRDEYDKTKNSTDSSTAVMAYLLAGSEKYDCKYHTQISLLEKALNTFINQGFILRTIYCLNDLGLAYMECFDYQKAIEALEKALVLAKQIKDQDRIAGVTNNLAMVYFNKKEYVKSKACALQVINSEKVASSAYSIVVASEYHLKNYCEAKKWLNTFEEYNFQHNDKYSILQARIMKSLIYEKTGSRYYSLLKKYLEFVQKEMPISVRIEALGYLIEYCEHNGLLNDLIDYQKLLIECYEKIKN